MSSSDAPADTFFSTCLRAIFRPRELFDHVSTAERRRWGPVSFALAVGALSASVGTFTAGLLEGAIALARIHRIGVARPLVAALAVYSMPIVVALGLRAGVVEAFKIPSGSMIPTLTIGDHIFVSKVAYGPLIPGTGRRLFSRLPPSRADVVVFKFPENPEQDFVKRVIATPGDTLELVNGRPVINGWLVPHCHVGRIHRANRPAELFVELLGERSYFTLFDANPDAQSCRADADRDAGLACRGGICGALQGPFHVAPEEVWVVGDDRDNSHDSRSWYGGKGAGVPFDHLKGRASVVWMSFGPGGVAQDRLFLDVHGPPKLPAEYATTLGPAVEKCLRERPLQTAPPAPRR